MQETPNQEDQEKPSVFFVFFAGGGAGRVQRPKHQVTPNWWFGLVVWGFELVVLVEGKWETG